MTRNEKVEIINTLTEEFKSSDAIVVCEYKGLKVKHLEVLRNLAKDADVKVQVAKNTLAAIAMKNADVSGIELSDDNIFIWGPDQLAVTKVVAKYAKDTELFNIKAAFIDGEVTDAAKVELLSKMPSRDELIGMLLQVWNAPITNFTIGLDALRAKQEQSA